jgi:hypothetical protein
LAFGMRIPAMPNYSLFLIPLAAVLILRAAALVAARNALGADPHSSTVR